MVGLGGGGEGGQGGGVLCSLDLGAALDPLQLRKSKAALCQFAPWVPCSVCKEDHGAYQLSAAKGLV